VPDVLKVPPQEELLADNVVKAMNETYQEENVDKTYPEYIIENISIMRAGTNKPPGTYTFSVKGLHTREKEEDLFTKEEPLVDNKVLAKYEDEGKPNVQDNINVQDAPNVPPQEELPADNETVTADIAKVLAYMDKVYKKKDAVPKTITHCDPPNYNIRAR
jgi:hypothetical protein